MKPKSATYGDRGQEALPPCLTNCPAPGKLVNLEEREHEATNLLERIGQKKVMGILIRPPGPVSKARIDHLWWQMPGSPAILPY